MRKYVYICRKSCFVIKIAPRILAAALLLSGLSAYGQQAKQTLSFDEALAAALQNNPALEAAVYEEKAAMQERRAAIGLRMPQINLSGAYAYLGKDIGLDLNDKKGALKGAAETILGSGVVPPEMIPTISGLINPLFSADWKLTLQDRSLGFIGSEVTLPLYLGGKINTANRAARINEQTAVEQSNQTRNALVSELVERYFGLTLARQVVEVRQQVVDGVRRHLEDAEALEKSYPDSPYLPVLLAEIGRMDARLNLASQITVTGYPDLELSDIYGKKVRLSSLEGKVVLVDFWSAELGNANARNAELKELYAKYARQKAPFEIYQVAIDTSKPLWITAVQEQQLPWISVSDLQGGASSALKLYNVQRLPSSYLISREGEIVARDLDGEALARKIDELLQ